MLIFLAGHRHDGVVDGERAAGVLRSILGATPFAEQFEVHSWAGPGARVALAWAVHRQPLLGDVEPAACEETRAALVAGRPIRWRGDGDADGREPPGGRAHLDGILDRLGGRFAVGRGAGHSLEPHPDVLAPSPVSAPPAPDGTWWASGL